LEQPPSDPKYVEVDANPYTHVFQAVTRACTQVEITYLGTLLEYIETIRTADAGAYKTGWGRDRQCLPTVANRLLEVQTEAKVKTALEIALAKLELIGTKPAPELLCYQQGETLEDKTKHPANSRTTNPLSIKTFSIAAKLAAKGDLSAEPPLRRGDYASVAKNFCTDHNISNTTRTFGPWTKGRKSGISLIVGDNGTSRIYTLKFDNGPPKPYVTELANAVRSNFGQPSVTGK